MAKIKKDIFGPFFYLWLPITSTPLVSSNISINNVSNITHLRYKNNRVSRYVILEMKMWKKSETVLYTLEHSFLSRIHTEISSLQNSLGFETNHVCGVIVSVFVSNVIDHGPIGSNQRPCNLYLLLLRPSKSRSEDSLARNQNNLSEWSYVCTCG